MNKKVNNTGASLRISNDVLTKIAEVAATEIRGVASEGEHLVICDKNMAQFTGKIMPQSPVKAVLKNDAVEVTVSIVVLQGFKAENVARSVQESVKSAIQNMAGILVCEFHPALFRLPAEQGQRFFTDFKDKAAGYPLFNRNKTD